MIWARGIDSLKSWEIQRIYFPKSTWHEIQNLEIHAFCDSSEKAYGALVYLRLPNKEDPLSVSLTWNIICLNAFVISELRATLHLLNRTNTELGIKERPVSIQSLREIPLYPGADASNTGSDLGCQSGFLYNWVVWYIKYCSMV